MGAYDYIQINSIPFMVEDFINQYEKNKGELSEVEANCLALIDALDKNKDKLKEDFYNRNRITYQKIIIDCHRQQLIIEKNIAVLNSIAVQMDVKKLGKYKKILEKEPNKIMESSSAVSCLRVECNANSKRVKEDIMLTDFFDNIEAE